VVEVSIIVPTYNRRELLMQTLKSIAGQTFQDFEVVLVNDAGSPVDDVIEGSGISDKIKYIVNEINIGQSKTLNVGLENAEGEYIAYLDDDDIYFANHLEVLYKFLSSNKLDFAYTKCIRTSFDPESGMIFKREVLPFRSFTRDDLLEQNFIPVINVMHRKDCLLKSGMFDENLKYLKDWDLFVRISRHYNFYHIDEITCEVFFRNDKSNMSFEDMDGRWELGQELRAKYLEKYGNSKELIAEDSDKFNELRDSNSSIFDSAVKKFSEYLKIDDFFKSHFKTFKEKGVNKAAVYGASLSGELYVHYLRKTGVEVVALFDGDPKKHGRMLEDLVIQPPIDIENCNCDSVIIASRGYRDEIFESIKYLDVHGINVFKE